MEAMSARTNPPTDLPTDLLTDLLKDEKKFLPQVHIFGPDYTSVP